MRYYVDEPRAPRAPRAIDVVRAALAQYDIRAANTWAGQIVMTVLVAACATRRTDYSAVIDEVGAAEGLAPDTMRRLLTDVLRPIIADNAAGRQRRLGVVCRTRGVMGAMEAVSMYWAARTQQAAKRFDNCRNVDRRGGAAWGGDSGAVGCDDTGAVSEGD